MCGSMEGGGCLARQAQVWRKNKRGKGRVVTSKKVPSIVVRWRAHDIQVHSPPSFCHICRQRVAVSQNCRRSRGKRHIRAFFSSCRVKWRIPRACRESGMVQQEDTNYLVLGLYRISSLYPFQRTWSATAVGLHEAKQGDSCRKRQA